MNATAAPQQWQYGHQPQPGPAHNPGIEELNVIQEPERAKVVVKSRAKERKPIDPPPVVELKVRDERPGPGQIPGVWIHSPYYICVVCLWDATYDRAYMPEDNEVPLYGSLVSSLNKLKNLQETEGAYFVFGDISIGIQGRFRLCFNLYNLDPTTKQGHYRGSAVSRPFDVTSAREWDGVKESTSLSRSFADQGVRLRLRKETRGNANSKRSFNTSSAPYTPMSESTTTSHDLGRSGADDDVRDSKRQRSFPSSSSTTDYSQQSGRPPYYTATTNGHQYSPYAYSGSGPYSPTGLQQHGNSSFMYTSSGLSYSQSPYASQQPQYSSMYSQQASSYPYASPSSTYGAQYGSSSYGAHQQQQAQYSSAYGTPGYGHRGSDQLPTPNTASTSPYASQLGYSGMSTAQGYGSRDPASYQGSGASVASPNVTRPMANPASTPTLAPLHRSDHGQAGGDDPDPSGAAR